MKKSKLKILVDSGFNNDYKAFLELKFDLEVITYPQWEKDKTISNNLDFVLFTGGADVNPTMYNEDKGSHTSINIARDKKEEDMFYRFDYLPKLGICRGSQFLTVMSGGRLIQHVDGHLGNHNIHIKSNSNGLYNENGILEYEITSTHHQMMYPFSLNKNNYKIIGWSKKFLSDTYLNGKDEEINLPSLFVEPEIVYYPNSNSLCVQGHPEFKSCPSNTSLMILNLISKILLDKKNEKLIESYSKW